MHFPKLVRQVNPFVGENFSAEEIFVGEYFCEGKMTKLFEKTVTFSVKFFPIRFLTILTGNCFTQFNARMTAWLLLIEVLYIPLPYNKESRCLKNVIHQIDSKYVRLLLSASFTAKFEFIFALTLENAFS